MRLDQYLVHHGLAGSRARAQRLIALKKVELNGAVSSKSSTKISDSDIVKLLEPDFKWASRGAFKLEKALDHWKISPEKKQCLDVGASTGGFTEVLLDRGARSVWALDVGHGQLVDYLREDDRVTCLEKTDIRTWQTAERFQLVVVDVSFISLKLILPVLAQRLRPSADLILLIKPQFEVGPANINNRGLVRDPVLYESVCDSLSAQSKELGFDVEGIIDSPIEGGDGNKEFLMYLRKH